MENNFEATAWQIDALLLHFALYGAINNELKKFICDNVNLATIKKGKYLISPLDQKPPVYFLCKGAVRGFVKNGRQEITTWLNKEGNIIGMTLFEKRRLPMEEFIQAIEACELVVIPYATIISMFSLFPEMFLISRNMLWMHYQEAEERNFIVRLPTGEMRLLRMMETQPELYYRAPLKYTASYLGMRLETLSRIRGKLSKKIV